ncbi:hypothetical protein ACCUM_0009 [Candidatus Accumulibacter phosphatis]|uniref:Uncharacterized protein n=1 Tax=Candidatus Accumulibacter phosphatis TaxID=327160 RepID=A0A5S4EH09_9PROT|nr:hypothetical protein ACCUM_0009 [Candidatus Accumulibacter phosphatis]
MIVFGCPFFSVKAVSGNIAHATIGAPALRRQSLQWHNATTCGSPESS